MDLPKLARILCKVWFSSRAVTAMMGFAVACGPFAGLSIAAKVKTWPGKDVDFSRYKTYSWLPVKVLAKTGVVENDDTAAPLIRNAVNRELAKVGLTEVGEGGDLQVSALALSESIPQLEAVILPQYFSELDYATPIATIGRYNKEGTLVVNLIITGTQKSAWLGMAKETIDRNPGAGLKKIDKATSDLFKKYPRPNAKK